MDLKNQLTQIQTVVCVVKNAGLVQELILVKIVTVTTIEKMTASAVTIIDANVHHR